MASRAAEIDRWLATLLGDERDVALVAVGGYGRRELAPCSDIDVLLLYGKKQRDIGAVAERLWYPLWDAGLKVGHGVRTVKDALKLADDDLDVATSLLTGRVVAGDASMAEDVITRARAQWRRRARHWLRVLADAVAERHARAGEVAFLLEPDLKEGRGGLRDVHALRWAEAAERVLLPGDDEALSGAYDTLLAARVELHRRTGKALDRLLLQEQDGVAEALGDADADALMSRIATAARTIAWTSDEAWRRVRDTLAGPVGRGGGRDREIGDGVVLRDGDVELTADADPAADAALVLRVAAAAATHGTTIGRRSLDRLAASAPVLDGRWPADARDSLVALLAAGSAAIPVFEALDQRDLMTRVLPEWETVRSRPQRNAYHRFTVDRHLCEAAAQAAALVGRVRRPDLLLVGTWLHDLGKGTTGDHVDVGVALIHDVAARMGFDADDVGVLVTLVRHHLLLADFATRRDLDDPATIAAVAEAVVERDTLALLHALTEADSLATGPAAWGRWKAGLVADLVARADRLLAGDDGGSVVAPVDQLSVRQDKAVAAARASGEPAVDVDDGVVVVAAPDRPGLFARVAGTLALHGLDVLRARLSSTGDGLAADEFEVVTAVGDGPDRDALAGDLRRALAGRLSLESRLADRARQYRPRPSAVAAAAGVPRTVAVVDDASAASTVVEVRAPDAPGTLYRIARALAELDLDVRHATVATYGHEVVDTFYVCDGGGQKLDGELAREVERAILLELSRV
ncbi:MAG TPA: [protein-PII] uridylyltransferase [Acidimicrobiales bacterium]|nr:[protein-PII] uridylyltransferase [Acidimicrobiales bacterium]